MEERGSRIGGPSERRLPVGAEVLPHAGVHFRVWAPERQGVEITLEAGRGAEIGRRLLEREPDGYFSCEVPEAGPGTRYRYLLDGEGPFPDPASRFQPDGPHGASRVEDPAAFAWSDSEWSGPGPTGQVIYELHIGTFTPEGTWAAAARELPWLAELGVTMLEVMPVADFPGRFGWGYDGTALFAPTRLYGEPDDFRRFVDIAHRHGLAVILDVVYNHLGPDGSYLGAFSRHYVSKRHHSEWGAALNFDGDHSGPVRELVLANVGYWVDEFHIDGYRLDAASQIRDDSEDHIVAALARRAREAAGGRRTFILAEHEPQDVSLVRPQARGGYGLDALWNDDFHHAARVALTGRARAYYSNYRGTPQELISSAKYGFLYQGQWHEWQRQRRGTPSLGEAPARFVTYLENHDQVANSRTGERLHQLTSPGRYRAMTALLMLAPGTPLLFQGQEFGASTRWVYFADHEPGLAAEVREGRFDFLSQFPELATPATRSTLPDPSSIESFESCKLDPAERTRNAAMVALHRDLLALRRAGAAFRAQRAGGVDGAVLGAQALVLRFFDGESRDDRLLLVNLGADLMLRPMSEPLLAPPAGAIWTLLWSSEDVRYDGAGAVPIPRDGVWHVPAQAALVLAPRAAEEAVIG